MSKVVIRKVKQNDMSAIYEIEEDTFSEAYPRFLLDFLARKYSRTFLVADENEKVIGYAVASIEGNNTGHLISIAVKKSHQKKGVGLILTLEIFKALEKFGVSHVKLEVRKSNHVAQNFYKKLGFQLKSISKGYYGSEDAYVFTRSI